MVFSGYEVKVTESFAADLDASVAYCLEQVGRQSAMRFLDEYDSFCRLVSGVPGHGSPIEGTTLRWRKLGVFVVVYDVDNEGCLVTLLRLYHLSSVWRDRAIKLKEM